VGYGLGLIRLPLTCGGHAWVHTGVDHMRRAMDIALC